MFCVSNTRRGDAEDLPAHGEVRGRCHVELIAWLPLNIWLYASRLTSPALDVVTAYRPEPGGREDDAERRGLRVDGGPHLADRTCQHPVAASA